MEDVTTDLDIPDAGILSKVVHRGAGVRVVAFAFDTGQELTEHTASVPAILQVIDGRFRITLGESVIEAVPGAWIHMESRLPHSLEALEPSRALLTMLS
ncbi:cupin domain-containing protein [bacterium]|nr:cupin domain-containing protein [bacterium]